LEWFKEQQPGISDQIASIRFQHYEEKRKGKMRLITDTLKAGMLEVLEETFKPQTQKSGSRPHARLQ